MKWILCLVVLFLCVISGLLGLTAGINLNPVSTVQFVPSWGSLGDWVSGLGALLAVLVTLWLADKQRREDVESLKVQVKSAIRTDGVGGWFISVTITGNGNRAAQVNSLSVHSPQAGHSLAITGYQHGSDALPASLSYGQSISLYMPPGFDQELNNFVEHYCGGSHRGLKFIVHTALRDFDAPIHKNYLDLSS